MAGVMLHASTVGQMPSSARRLQVQARMAWLSGQFDEAQSLGRQAWDAADDLDPSDRDRLAAMLAQIAILQDEGAAAVEWAQRALARNGYSRRARSRNASDRRPWVGCVRSSA